jgi:hypothetical protein
MKLQTNGVTVPNIDQRSSLRAKRSNLIASAKTPRPVKYWPKASAGKRHLTGRAMTGYGDSMPVKQSIAVFPEIQP